MKKRFLSILCAFALLCGMGAVIPISASESTEVFVDELTDLSNVSLSEGPWEIHPNHADIGRSVIGRPTGAETDSNLYYSFSDQYISAISVTIAEHTGYFNAAQISVAVRTKGSDAWTAVSMTFSDETDIEEATNQNFKQVILTSASLPANVTGVRIGLTNDVGWTLFLDRVSLDLIPQPESDFTYITDDFSSDSQYATYVGMGIYENYPDFARNVAWRTTSTDDSYICYKVDEGAVKAVTVKADLFTGYGAQNNIALAVRASDQDEWTAVNLTYGAEETIPEFPDTNKRTLTFTGDIALPNITQVRISLTNIPWVMVLENVTLKIENILPVVGDLTGDGRIDILDLVRFKKMLASGNALEDKYDLNGDTLKDTGDLALLRKNLLGTAAFDSAEVLNMKRELVNYRAFSDNEIYQIAITQLSDWAIPVTAKTAEGKATINPYFADYAAMAMLERPENYATNVLYYINWHFDHLNADGTIYDYQLESNELSTAGTYDSTDSYAATFLSLLWKYYSKTKNASVITNNAEKIALVISALESTMDQDLTYATADFKVKYTMDNCEVFAGLSDAAKLYSEVLSDADKAAELTQKAERVAAAIESLLWNPNGYYEVGIKEDGSVSNTYDSSKYYPSGMAQLFPLLTGVLDPASDRAQSVYQSFLTSFDITNLSAVGDYYSIAAYAAAVMGDGDTFSKYVSAYQERFGSNLRYNPYTGLVAMASEIMQQKLLEKIG